MFDNSIIHILSIVAFLAVFAFLLLQAVIDVRHYLLPDKWNAALAGCFLVLHLTTQWQLIPPISSLLGVCFGGGMLWLIRFAANRYYNEDALGLGDVKLMAAAGLGLGFPNVLLALSIGSLVGLLHGFVIKLYGKYKTGENIPFEKINVPAGLGLTAGIAIVMLIKFGFEWM